MTARDAVRAREQAKRPPEPEPEPKKKRVTVDQVFASSLPIHAVDEPALEVAAEVASDEE